MAGFTEASAYFLSASSVAGPANTQDSVPALAGQEAD